MSEFRLFMRGVRKHAGTTVTGVAVTVIGLVWQIAQWISPTLEAPRFQPWMLWLPGMVLCFYSCFLAWRDEYRGRLKADAKAIANLPDFAGFINKMAFEDPVGGVCVAYLLVSVENTGGRPSILHNWRMYVQPPDKLEQEVSVGQPIDGTDCRLSSESGNEVFIGYDQFLSVKSYPKGIKPGDGRRGFMRAELPEGLPEGTRFVLTFKDVHKRRVYTCEYDTAQRKGRADDVKAIGSWPGVKIKHGRVSVSNQVP